MKPNMKVSKKDLSIVKENSIGFYKNLTLPNKMTLKMMYTFLRFTKKSYALLMLLIKKQGNFLMTDILNFIVLCKEGLISWCKKWTNNWVNIEKFHKQKENKSSKLLKKWEQ